MDCLKYLTFKNIEKKCYFPHKSALHWEIRGQARLKDTTIRAGSGTLIKYPAVPLLKSCNTCKFVRACMTDWTELEGDFVSPHHL